MIETDVRRLDIYPVDNSGSFYKEIEPGGALPANAFALLVTVTDSVLRVTVGNGACSKDEPRRYVNSFVVSSLPGAATSTQPPVVLTAQLYIQQDNRLPAPLAEYVRDALQSSRCKLLILCYGKLPVYGQQRWRVETGLSDGTTLTATTPIVNLTP